MLVLVIETYTSLAKRCTIPDTEDVWYKVRKLIPLGGIMTCEKKIGRRPELLENIFVTSSLSVRYENLKD